MENEETRVFEHEQVLTCEEAMKIIERIENKTPGVTTEELMDLHYHMFDCQTCQFPKTNLIDST